MAKKRIPTKEELKLWRDVNQGTHVLSSHQDDDVSLEIKTQPVPSLVEEKNAPLSSKGTFSEEALSLFKFDHRFKSKIKNKKIVLDASLDLHGLTEKKAHDALLAFVKSQYTQKHRLLLIITGKGKSSSEKESGKQEGVLKRSLPLWLETPFFLPYIHSYTSASREHGGEGAFYVYLRRSSHAKQSGH